MEKNIELRVFSEAEFMLKNKCTVREMTRFFNVSKSTVHNDLSKKLKVLNKELFFQVDKILKFNFSVKHLRGGRATKQKFLKKKQQKNEKKINFFV